MKPIKVITHKGHEINVYHDDHAMSPQEMGDDSECFLVYGHRDFTVNVKGYDPDEIFEHIMETKKNTFNGFWVFPVYAYIHSGVALSLGKNSYPFTCKFDTSFKGFALVKVETWQTIEEAQKIAGLIVDEWNMYLSGDVYYINTEFDSFGGVYGDEGLKDAISEAKAIIDHHVNKQIKAHLNTLKAWIKNKVGLTYRTPLKLA